MPNEPLLTRKSYKEQLEKQNRELEELETRARAKRQSRDALMKEKKSFSLNMRKKVYKYTVLQNQDYENTIIS